MFLTQVFSTEFFSYLVGVVLCSAFLGWIYGEFLRLHDDRLQADHPHKPIPTYKKWEVDDTRDIRKVSMTKIPFNSNNIGSRL